MPQTEIHSWISAYCAQTKKRMCVLALQKRRA